MVAKQTLPELRRNRTCPKALIMITMIFWCGICKTVAAVQFCWTGTEDDLSGWKNQSCATGTTSLGNALSTKLLPSHDDGNETQGQPTTDSFYCMAFKRSETSAEGNGISVRTFTVEYSCDFEHVCTGRQMNVGFSFQRNGSEGMLYCCNDVNNCNKHTLIQNKPHAHQCYKASSDGSTKTIDLETCPSEDTYCVMVSKRKSVVDEGFSLVSENYSCDINNLCEEKGLTDSLGKSCKMFKDPKTDLYTEVCCCKDDICFMPGWVGDGTAHTVQNTGTPTNAIQRTILIGIGIAIGLLLAAVAIFIAMKYRKSESNKKQNSHCEMVYSAVMDCEDTRDMDNVNILPRA